MKLLISQLSEGENRFQYDSSLPEGGWVREIVARVGKAGYTLRSPLTVSLQLTKLEPDYYLRGKMGFEVEQVCARCAEAFGLPIQHSFDVAMAHVNSVKVRSAEITEESEELDVNFFEGNEIDLSPVMEEQFFLSLPYQTVCKPDCKGLCPRCGTNLNQGKCGCASVQAPNAFSVLGNLKV